MLLGSLTKACRAKLMAGIRNYTFTCSNALAAPETRADAPRISPD